MKRKLVMHVALGFCAALMLGSENCCAQESGREPLRIKGSSTMSAMVNQWAGEFGEKIRGVNIVVTGSSTADGFAALLGKSAHLVMASRMILQEENERATNAGIKVEELIARGECVVISTHPEASIRELTLEQLGKIFSGDINRWNELGGPNEKIIVNVCTNDDGTGQFLRDVLMDGQPFSANAVFRSRYYEILRDVASRKPWSIAYSGLADALRQTQKTPLRILGVKEDAASPAVIPSDVTSANRTYPLVQPFYFYWDGNSEEAGLRAFIDFCKTKL
jgi:phosphate transport system substrate-binding protein